MKFEIYDIRIMPFIELCKMRKRNGKLKKKPYPVAHFHSSFKIKVREILPLASAFEDDYGQIFTCFQVENVNTPISYLRLNGNTKDTLLLSKTLNPLP